jgi:uncharacterized protein with FMN-binding domain
MRRSPIVLAATVAGTAGVLAFHPHAVAAPTATAATAATTTASTPASTSSSSASNGSGSSGSSGTSGGSSSSSSSSTTTAVSGTATGDAIDTQYGPVQVRVTVKDGKITAIQGLVLTGNDPRSAEISSFAEPTLRQEALTKQTADIDAVSGATFTSAGYAQSLQSALDKLGFKAADGSRATLQVP